MSYKFSQYLSLFNGVAAEPSAPNSDELYIYAEDTSGKMMPKFKGPAGTSTAFQPAFFGNNICMWTTTTTSTGFWIGTTGSGGGTYVTLLPTTTSNYTAMKRGLYSNAATTLNQVLGVRSTEAMFFRGSTGVQGGFFFFCRFGLEAWTTGARLFIGLATGSAVIASDPSALNNTVGFCVDAGDTAITFLTRDTSTPTKTSISGQPALASGQGYDAYIFCKPNDNTIYFRLDNLNTGATIINSSTTSTLPVNTTLLTSNSLASNAALTSINSVRIGVNKIYIESNR